MKKQKEEKWIKIKNGWVKGKDGLKFWKEMNRRRVSLTKTLQPRACYTSEYDIFNLIWGQKQIASTFEVDLNGEGLRFDVTKDGTIVGIEIDNISEVLKKFDCDKKKHGKNNNSN